MQQIMDETTGSRACEEGKVAKRDDDREGKQNGQGPPTTTKGQPPR